MPLVPVHGPGGGSSVVYQGDSQGCGRPKQGGNLPSLWISEPQTNGNFPDCEESGESDRERWQEGWWERRALSVRGGRGRVSMGAPAEAFQDVLLCRHHLCVRAIQSGKKPWSELPCHAHNQISPVCPSVPVSLGVPPPAGCGRCRWRRHGCGGDRPLRRTLSTSALVHVLGLCHNPLTAPWSRLT